MKNTLILKSIKELLGYKFFIPSYQRGYRWTEIQVIQLLDDIWEFSKREKGKGEFYCLQPIVVKKINEIEWEVIDGQQRLTTIFIILKYFEDICKMLDSKFKLYTIDYATRKGSSTFLENIASGGSQHEDNIDFFFMYSTFHTIDQWFQDRDVNKLDFINTLQKQQLENISDNENNAFIDNANNVRVIWYEVDSQENTDSIYNIFTRLNIGKIPLTNAELIKALLLQKRNFPKESVSLKQIQIATEWDTIEKTLQDDSFWYFIYDIKNPINYENRIEYIFDMMRGRTKHKEAHFTFNAFYNDLVNHQVAATSIWLNVKQFFLTLEEWFKDYTLFHYIGFLVDCGIPVIEIKKNSDIMPKDVFKHKYLVNQIRTQVNFDINNITYSNKSCVRKILLLFNIQTVLETQKSDMRFPFNRYKSDKWDIEHICSQTDYNIHAGKRSEWYEDIIEYFVGSNDSDTITEYIKNNSGQANIIKIIESIQSSVSVNEEDVKFNNCYNMVRSFFKEDNQKEDRDDISNLTLLDASTNRSYGNSFFPIKRRRIIDNDSKGIFVPIATKNLFLKYYSNQLGDVMYWSNQDANDYMAAIKKVLSPFIPTTNTQNNG